MIRSVLISGFLYSVIFMTGFAGLVYQVCWQKYVSRLLGNDSTSTAIILATFLGGLSLGYYLCGKLTTRVRNHFKAYAILEGVVGAWCLNFPVIFDAVESFTRSWEFSPPLLIMVQGGFCSILLMGIPTVCMGGTIPFLTRGLSENITEATHIHANVYSVNTAGAFLGTLLAGFYLIPEYGLPLTVMGTAALNFGACLFFYLLSATAKKRKEADVSSSDPVNQPLADIRYSPLVLYLIAFLSGFYVMTLENVLIRITNLSLGSSSYTFSLIVSVFILSIAAGSYAVGKLKTVPDYLLFVNQFLIALFLILIYISLDTWPYWSHIVRIAFQSNAVGFWAYYGGVFLVLMSVLILPVGLMGATVPIAFHEIKRDLPNVGKHSGILFSVNTVGNLVGSLMGGIVFYYFMNNAKIFLTAVSFAAISTGLASGKLARRYALSALLLTVSIVLFIFTPFYNEHNFTFGTFREHAPLPYSLEGPKDFFYQYDEWGGKIKVKFYKDGPVSTVGVVEFPGKTPAEGMSLSIMVNGKADSSTAGDIFTLKLLAHLPALLAEKIKSVMVIGLGTGVTAGEMTLYPDTEHIDIAEISPTVVEALPCFREFNYNVRENPKVTIHIGDAFRILGRSRKKWDIIISEPSNPWVTGVDLLFTQEFYKLAKEHLSDKGILVQWAHIYSSNDRMIGMILNTIRSQFEHCHIFITDPGLGDVIFVATDRYLSADDLERAAARFDSNPKVRESLGKIALDSADAVLIREIWSDLYSSERFSDAGIQTMDYPRLHYIAGKSFFTGDSVAFNQLFNATSAAYSDDFLMARKYENWKGFPLSKEAFDILLASVTNRKTPYNSALENSLKLKAYLAGSDVYLLSEEDKKKLETDLISFVMNLPENEEEWDKIALKNASFRKKAEVLLSYEERFRNWIVPYPVEGLKELLKNGMVRGEDIYEKNWCVLHLIRLLLRERADKEQLRAAADFAVRGADGEITVKEEDRLLLKIVKSALLQIRK